MLSDELGDFAITFFTEPDDEVIVSDGAGLSPLGVPPDTRDRPAPADFRVISAGPGAAATSISSSCRKIMGWKDISCKMSLLV